MSNTEIKPSNSLGYMELWEERNRQRRVEELTQAFIAKLANEDMEKMAMKAKKAFKPVPMFTLPEGKNIEEVYGENARKLAEEILEQERQNYVTARADRDKAMLTEIARKLRYLVLVVNEKGVAEKLKITLERVTQQNYKGHSETCDIMYYGDHDVQRLNQIWALKQRLEELKDFYPYYVDEVKALYDQAMELASLEIVRKEG